MKIGIDARLWYETGVGRYIRNLVREITSLDSSNTYIIFVPPAFSLNDSTQYLQDNVIFVSTNVHWHTLKEQLVMPRLYKQYNLDLVHIPYFNIPIFTDIPIVLTVHDLTILHYATGKATTRSLPVYLAKQLGYRVLLTVGLPKARRIIAVSETTKKEIFEHFGISGDSMTVIYEGIESSVTGHSGHLPVSIQPPYFLYVGNAYPHKNLEFLIHSYMVWKNKTGQPHVLVLAGKDDYFYNRLKTVVTQKEYTRDIRILNDVSDGVLAALYRNAAAFIMPSFMEGFGLPVLEAVVNRCTLVLSDIPVFHELVGNHAMYFNPKQSESLYRVLDAVLECDDKPNDGFIDIIKKRFSWSSMARKTLDLYSEVLR